MILTSNKCTIPNIASFCFIILSIGTVFKTNTKKRKIKQLGDEISLLNFRTKLKDAQDQENNCPSVDSLSLKIKVESQIGLKHEAQASGMDGGSKYKELPKVPVSDPLPGLPPIVEDYFPGWGQKFS